jgi:ATP synthase F1 gamma subunit
VSKSLVTRFKRELRTTTDLMELVDVLKRVALSQFHSLDGTRQRLGWTTAESSGDGTDPPGRRSAQASEPPLRLADPDAASPALSLSIVLEDFFRLIPPAHCRHPFLEPPAPPLGMVIVTSDEGFLGGLNSAVIQKALASRDGPTAELMVLGERGSNYFKELGQPFKHFPGIGERIAARRVEALRDYIVAQFLRRAFARVVVVYPRPLSFSHQEVDVVQLLPYARPSGAPGPAAPAPTDTILEPSARSIIEYLVKLWVTRKLHEVFWQSRLAELGARAMHLEASFQELGQQRKKQTLQYFRGLHEVTDTSIRETYAGVVARRRQARERRP